MGHVKVEWLVKRGPSSSSRGRVEPSSQMVTYLGEGEGKGDGEGQGDGDGESSGQGLGLGAGEG